MNLINQSNVMFQDDKDTKRAIIVMTRFQLILTVQSQKTSKFQSGHRVVTRPNSWAKQVREIEWGHLTLDSMTF